MFDDDDEYDDEEYDDEEYDDEEEDDEYDDDEYDEGGGGGGGSSCIVLLVVGLFGLGAGTYVLEVVRLPPHADEVLAVLVLAPGEVAAKLRNRINDHALEHEDEVD